MIEPILVVGGGLALLGGVVVLSWLHEEKRSEAFLRYAAQRGWTFERNGLGRMDEVSSFKLFSRGRERRLTNVVFGPQDGVTVSVGDYRYTVDRGRSARTHHQTLCVVRVPGLDLPHFFVRRQVMLVDDLGKLLGGQDLNFEEDPDFSKAWVLQTEGDEHHVRRVFHPRARMAFTAGLAGKSPEVEAHGDALLLHFGRRLGVDELDGLIADAVNLARCWQRG